MMAYIKKFRILLQELDELRTTFLTEKKNETFSKGVSAGIIISLNYISAYFPEVYGRWSENHLDDRMKKFIKKQQAKKRF